MASYNKCTFIGHLGKDPTLRKAGDQDVCSFSIAVNRTWMQQGEKKEEVMWVNVSVWGKQAAACEKYLAKGRPALVEGRISLREYEDRDGQQRQSLDLAASSVVFLGDRDGGQATKNPAPSSAPQPSANEDDEIPF